MGEKKRRGEKKVEWVKKVVGSNNREEEGTV